MAERKKTPDILANLLEGKSKEVTSENTSEPVSKHTSTPVNQSTDNMVSHNTSSMVSSISSITPEPSIEKVKATHYFSQEVLDALDEAWYKMRKQVRREIRDSISKSFMVEVAVKMALQELEVEGLESKYASKLINQ